MRVTTYKTVFDENRKPSIVKESACNYGAVRDLSMPENVARLIDDLFQASNLPEEYVWLIATDRKHHPIGVMELSHGGCDQTYLGPREVFWRLCMCGANGFFLVHNHPSGSTAPSGEDNTITERINEASKIMGINFVDHIIIGGNRYFSYREADKI